MFVVSHSDFSKIFYFWNSKDGPWCKLGFTGVLDETRMEPFEPQKCLNFEDSVFRVNGANLKLEITWMGGRDVG